jgi:hypothetical protein
LLARLRAARRPATPAPPRAARRLATPVPVALAATAAAQAVLVAAAASPFAPERPAPFRSRGQKSRRGRFFLPRRLFFVALEGGDVTRARPILSASHAFPRSLAARARGSLQ